MNEPVSKIGFARLFWSLTILVTSHSTLAAGLHDCAPGVAPSAESTGRSDRELLESSMGPLIEQVADEAKRLARELFEARQSQASAQSARISAQSAIPNGFSAAIWRDAARTAKEALAAAETLERKARLRVDELEITADSLAKAEHSYRAAGELSLGREAIAARTENNELRGFITQAGDVAGAVLSILDPTKTILDLRSSGVIDAIHKSLGVREGGEPRHFIFALPPYRVPDSPHVKTRLIQCAVKVVERAEAGKSLMFDFSSAFEQADAANIVMQVVAATGAWSSKAVENSYQARNLILSESNRHFFEIYGYQIAVSTRQGTVSILPHNGRLHEAHRSYALVGNFLLNGVVIRLN